MNRLCLWPLIVCLLLVGQSTRLQAAVSASVDRTELSMGESFVLTLQAGDLKVFSRPNLSALDADFDVLGTSQNSSTRLVNGNFTSQTNWEIQLTPKRPGKTSIPPIAIGKEKTHTIEIQVNHQSSQAQSSTHDGIFIEAAMAENTVYVNAQALLTIKIGRARDARFQLQEPEHEDAQIIPVNEVTYQHVRGEKLYRITERTFAVFPTRSGELVIDPLTLVADLISDEPRSVFGARMGRTRRVLRRTEPLTLNVIPPPADTDAAAWLPAKKVTLREEWSEDPQQLQLGDSVTRTIELQGKGVTAAQLPPLFQTEVEGLKFYPDQPSVGDQASALGVTGKRVEKMAMVATRPGRFELPAQSVEWWDVQQNRWMSTQLPARQIEVAPVTPTIDNGIPDTSEVLTLAGKPALSGAAKPWYRVGQWWVISAVLSLACVCLGVLYFRARHQLHARTDADQQPMATDEQQSFTQLRQACHSGEAAVTYQALLQWGRQFWGRGLPGIADMEATGANPELIEQAMSLQRYLYGDGQPGSWNPQQLLNAVSCERQAAAVQQQTGNEQHLPPLYPAA